jgi:hypothetical protein
MTEHNTCILLGRPLLPAFWILGTFYGCNFLSERKTKIGIMCSFPETVQFPFSYALKHSNKIFRVLNIVSKVWKALEKTVLVQESRSTKPFQRKQKGLRPTIRSENRHLWVFPFRTGSEQAYDRMVQVTYDLRHVSNSVPGMHVLGGSPFMKASIKLLQNSTTVQWG